VISLRTDDRQRDADRLKANGVMFVKEPYSPTGGTAAAWTRSSTTPAPTPAD
jgi:hypothetical protein